MYDYCDAPSHRQDGSIHESGPAPPPVLLCNGSTGDLNRRSRHSMLEEVI